MSTSERAAYERDIRANSWFTTLLCWRPAMRGTKSTFVSFRNSTSCIACASFLTPMTALARCWSEPIWPFVMAEGKEAGELLLMVETGTRRGTASAPPCKCALFTAHFFFVLQTFPILNCGDPACTPSPSLPRTKAGPNTVSSTVLMGRPPAAASTNGTYGARGTYVAHVLLQRWIVVPSNANAQWISFEVGELAQLLLRRASRAGRRT